MTEGLSDWLENWGYNATPDHGLFIQGGEVADFAMAVALKGVRRRGRTILCVSALEFMDVVNSGAWWDRLLNVSCLAVTNFGSHYRDSKGFIDSNFSRLINTRFDYQLPTIFVSKKSFAELGEALPQNIVNPIAKGCVEITCR